MAKIDLTRRTISNANFKPKILLTGRELRRRKAREEKKNGSKNRSS